MGLRHLTYLVAIAELHVRRAAELLRVTQAAPMAGLRKTAPADQRPIGRPTCGPSPAPPRDGPRECVADVAAGSRVSRRIDSRLLDEAVDAYVDWREECAGVWSAYGRWLRATVVDAPLAFSAYRAAVDREECAAHVYGALMTRIAVALNREPETPACPTGFCVTSRSSVLADRRFLLRAAGTKRCCETGPAPCLLMNQPARDQNALTEPSTSRATRGERAGTAAVDAPDIAYPALARGLGDRLGAAITCASTEHFNLQTARSITVSESNGRASIFLAALSTNLVALAFVGQMSRLGTAFYAFALILLPALALVGVLTFQRLVQSSIEDIAYAERIGRLRDFYLQLVPELEPYVVVVRGQQEQAMLHGERLAPSAWQLTLTTAGMVAVVDSVVIAACAGLLLEAVGMASLALAIAVGALIGAAALSLHHRHHRQARDAYRPEAIDQASIFVPLAQRADAP